MGAQKQGTPTSPWEWSSGSDANGNSITLTFNYNETTHVLISLVSNRDVGCVWTHLEIGLGAQTKTLPVPAGSRTFTAAQIQAATTFTSIDEIWALNFTVA